MVSVSLNYSQLKERMAENYLKGDAFQPSKIPWHEKIMKNKS